MSSIHHPVLHDSDDAPGISLHIAIVSTFLILFAVFLLSVSFRYFIYTIAIAGFLLGAMVTWMLMTAAEPLEHRYPNAPIVYTCGCFGAGVLVAGVLMYYWRVGLYALPALAGYGFAIFIWSWKEDFILHNVYARQFTSAGFAVAGVFLALVFEFIIVILSTSFLGAYSLIFALDLLLRAGMVNGPRLMLDFNPQPRKDVKYELTQKVYAMLGGVIGLWLVAVLWQMAYNRGRRFGLELVPKKEKE